MMLARIGIVALIATTGLQAVSAAADNRGWYVGGEIGYADADIYVGEYALKDNIVGIGAYGGYNFNEWFGLEASTFHSEDLADNRENLDSAYLFTLSFMPKFTIPIGSKVGLFAKFGPTFVLYTEEYDDWRRDRRRWDDDADWSETLFGTAVGVNIDIANGIQLRVVYDYVTGKLDESSDRWAPVRRVDVDIARAAVGVHYQF